MDSITEYDAILNAYVAKYQDSNLLQELSNSKDRLLNGAQKITKSEEKFRYMPEKWSVKEVLQHLVDAERIFSYRALCFARGEKRSLFGFDKNDYAKKSMADKKELQQIISEFSIARTATISLFSSFDNEQLARMGTANNKLFSVRAIGAIIIGHEIHHLETLNNRYRLNF